MKEKKKEARGEKKRERRAEARRGRKRDGASEGESGWKRDRGIVRATRACIASGNERSEGPVRNAEGARGGARGGTEGGIRRVKEVRSEEGERASEMRA